MKNQLTNEILDILKAEETEIFSLMKIPNISDELYDKLVVAISSIGGTWSERHKGFVFSEKQDLSAKERIKNLVDTGEYNVTEEAIWREKVQFFPTPTKIARQMVEMAELKEGDVVLEPSAGRGNILDLFPDYVEKVAVELDSSNVEVLHTKGYEVFWGDFLAMKGLKCNKVIMNPPFSRSQDAEHIVHAYNILKTGGTLVAIVNENTLLRKETNEKCRKLAELLDNTDHEVIHLPEGTFAESGTMINTAIVKINKK